MKAIKNILDKSLELLVIIATAALVADVLWQVFTRFVLKDPSSWTEELATFLLIWVALLGAAVALNRGAHLGIDYFVGMLDRVTQVYIEMFVFLCIIIFSIGVMVYGGLDLVRVTFQLQQQSPALNLEMGYVYLAVPISGGFMALYSFIAFAERLAACIKGKPAIEKVVTKHEQLEEVD